MPLIPQRRRTSKRLVHKAQQGDARAFEALCKAHENSLYRVAASYFHGNEADIADVVQKTLISAWSALGSLHEARFFKSWLIRICINECHQVHRNLQSHVSLSAIPEETLDASLRRNGTIDETSRFAEETDANEAFKRLVKIAGDSYAPVMVLYYGEGYSTDEIAALLNLSPDAVRQRLSRGRQRIAQTLSQPHHEAYYQQGACNES